MPAANDMLPRLPGSVLLPPGSIHSNGRYSTLLGPDGTGFSWLDRWVLTPWGGGPLAVGSGCLLYLREPGQDFLRVGEDAGTSAAPSFGREPGRSVYRAGRGGLEVSVEVCVSGNADGGGGAELRRVRLHNRSDRVRDVELTTYGEVVLHEPLAHASHPAFSRLFVRSEFVQEGRALLFRRRARAEGESFPWMIHALLSADPVEYETDRARFLGRGRDAAGPIALCGAGALTGSTGDVLDPVFSLRTRLAVGPGATVERTFLLGAAPDRASVLGLLELGGSAATAPSDRARIDVVEAAFAAAAQVESARWSELGISAAQAAEFERLAAAILRGDPAVRPTAEVVRESRRHPATGEAGDLRPLMPYASGQDTGDSPLGSPDPAAAARYWKALNLPIDVAAPGPGGTAR